MPLTTRRQFVQQATWAATALYHSPIKALDAVFEASEQNARLPDAASLRTFASEITGHVITAEAPDYDSARLVFNRAFDRRPALIVRCGGPSDVARALDFAQTHSLPLAVRGGGHNRAGFST